MAVMDDLIEKIHKCGFFVNGLAELPSGEWRCNLTNYKEFYEFGRGATPLFAMEAALEKALTTDPVPPYEQTEEYKRLIAEHRAKQARTAVHKPVPLRKAAAIALENVDLS